MYQQTPTILINLKHDAQEDRELKSAEYLLHMRRSGLDF